MADQRNHPRTKFRARVHVTHPEHGVGAFRTGDISDGGLFLENGPFPLALGELVTVQVQDMPMEAPVLSMRVVRITPGGSGLRFFDPG